MSVWKRLTNVAWGTTKVWRRGAAATPPEVEAELAETRQGRTSSTVPRPPPAAAAPPEGPVTPVPRTDLFVPDNPQRWLVAWIERAGGVAGTVHRVVEPDTLELVAHHRIPEPVLAVTREIPKGKGMAGLAWSRNTPVQTCDLQSDTSGDVRPGARAVEAGSAVALPVRVEGRVVAVVGVAFARTGDISVAEIEALQSQASSVPLSATQP